MVFLEGMMKRFVVILLALVLVVAGAYFALEAYARQWAEKKIARTVEAGGDLFSLYWEGLEPELFRRRVRLENVKLMVPAGMPLVELRAREMTLGLGREGVDVGLKGIEPRSLGLNAETLGWLGYDPTGMECSGELTAEFDPGSGLLKVRRLWLALPDAGELDLSATLTGVNLRGILENVLVSLPGATIVEAHARYTDHSLAERCLVRGAEESGCSEDQFKFLVIERIKRTFADMPGGEPGDQAGPAARALEAFVLRPGSLVFDMEPAQPASLSGLLGYQPAQVATMLGITLNYLPPDAAGS